MGSDGQNHIVAQTPLKLLPEIEFIKRRKSINNDMDFTVPAANEQVKTTTMQSTKDFDHDTNKTKLQKSNPKPPKKTKRKPKYVIKW